MKIYHFDKNKFNNGILMEAGKIEEVIGFDFSSTVYCTDFFEILFISKGEGHLILDTHKIEVTGGTLLFISPYQKRKWFLQKKIKGYFLVFEQAFLNAFFADKLFVYKLHYFFNPHIKTYLKIDKKLFPFERDVFDEIADEVQHTKEDSAHLLRALLYYILIKLNRDFSAFHHLKINSNSNINAYRFKEALSNNIREKQRVNDYAQLLDISRITLNEAVKRQFSKTVSTMITECLLEEIKNELVFSTKTISEIAFELHFSEPQHLIRFFKRQMQLTPLEFRLRNGEEINSGF